MLTSGSMERSLRRSTVSEGKLPCPKCPSSDAFFRYDDGHGYCFSCSYYEPANKKEEFNLSDFTYEYVPLRGINKETLQFYDVKTKINSEGKPVSVGFRYSNGSYKVRHLDRKDFYTEGDISKAGLYGRNKFSAGSHKYVTITEGEIDALSLAQALRVGTSGYPPVLSVQSSVTAGRDCAVDRAFLNSFERIYLAFDADEPGRRACAEVARLFDYNKVYVVGFTKRKDANDYLQHGEGDELRHIWWNSKPYLPDTIVSSLETFKKIVEQPPVRGVAYPFPTLTEMTYGIRTGESVLITAQEGVGKTELMHAIEVNLLKETNSNVGAIFLEEPKRRHLQALAGIHLKAPVHLPDSGCSVADVSRALEELVQEDGRLLLYSHFGSNDPDVLLDTIRFMVSGRSVRYVLLDHITMAVTGLAGEDERKALDYLATRLEVMVKELDFALIFVSHVNDFGQTRGSRYISKIADIRIDAHRDVVSKDPVERNTVHLTVSKSRDVGKTGPAGDYMFDQFTRQWTELVHANDEIQVETGPLPSGDQGLAA